MENFYSFILPQSKNKIKVLPQWVVSHMPMFENYLESEYN